MLLPGDLQSPSLKVTQLHKLLQQKRFKQVQRGTFQTPSTARKWEKVLPLCGDRVTHQSFTNSFKCEKGPRGVSQKWAGVGSKWGRGVELNEGRVRRTDGRRGVRAAAASSSSSPQTLFLHLLLPPPAPYGRPDGSSFRPTKTKKI